MFRHTLGARIALNFAPVLMAGALLFPSVAHAQAPRHTSRRINANRQARIARDVQQTYSYKWDVFGGGGYLRFRSGQDLQNNNMVTWATSATRNLSPTWGITGDIRGAYGGAKVGNNIYNVYDPLINEYTFMAGPQYRFYRREKTSVSASVLGGIALGNFDGGSKAIPAANLRMWDTGARPVFSANVNFDYNVYTNLALRIAPTYMFHTYTGQRTNQNGDPTGGTVGGFQQNLGVNLGLVYRFGGHK